jgi:methyl-accepting chemotaxis protein
MLKAIKLQPNLKFWLPAYILYSIGLLFTLLGNISRYNGNESSLGLVAIPFFILTVIWLSIVAFRIHSKILKSQVVPINDGVKSQNLVGSILLLVPALIFQNGMEDQSNSYMLYSSLLVFLLLLASFYPIVKLYQFYQTPTYMFMILIYVVFGLNNFSTVVESFGVPEAEAIRAALGPSIGLSFISVAIAALIEDKLVQKELSIRKKNEQITKILKQNFEMAEILMDQSETLSTNAEEVTSASESIASAQQNVSKGATSQVQSVLHAQKKFNELNGYINNIHQEISKIAEIVVSIKSIADQTNMLALNAAIEAARAGEYGRGFNVVADQVRKLSVESKKSSEQSEVLLNKISQYINAQEGASRELIQNIDEIAAVAEETSSSSEETAAAAEEQAASMESISSNVMELLDLSRKLKQSLDLEE